MSETPSSLGDAAFPVTRVFQLSTAEAAYYTKTSGTSTGTKLTTSRAIDLSILPHFGATGGKPLDATVHPRNPGVPRFKSVKLSVPLKITFQTSGLNAYVTAALLHRAATSGAGSTWASLVSKTVRYKMGTDTDAIIHDGFAVSANAQAIRRYLKANITFSTRKPTSTAAKDTTTGVLFYCGQPLIELSGAEAPYTAVPKTV